MPFKSKSQMRYLFAKEPEVAEKFRKEQKAQHKSFKNLPEKVGKKEKFSRLKKHMGGK